MLVYIRQIQPTSLTVHWISRGDQLLDTGSTLANTAVDQSINQSINLIFNMA